MSTVGVCGGGVGALMFVPPQPFASMPVGERDTPTSSGAGERILLVEDAPMNQLVARRALEHLGYRPVIANSGQLAMTLLDESEFAVVLMDCSNSTLE
ncbi:MAG: response regulator [Chloroflexota bacterium]